MRFAKRQNIKNLYKINVFEQAQKSSRIPYKTNGKSMILKPKIDNGLKMIGKALHFSL